MPAKSKTELLDVTQKEFAKLVELIEVIPTDMAVIKDEDGISIKDVVAHRAHWIDLFLGWHADGLEGKKVYFPAQGYKWNDLKRYNADLRERQSDLDWPGAVTMLYSRADKLTKLILGYADKDLYGAPMKGAQSAWTIGRWAEAAGPSHYRSASKFLRSHLRQVK